MVVTKQGIQRSVGAVLHRLFFLEADLVLRKVHPHALGIAFLSKGSEKAHRMAEVVAHSCRLPHMLL